MTTLTVERDMRARRDAVRLPPRRVIEGIASLPEILASYGIYILFGALALAAAAWILDNVLGDSVVDDVEAVVSSVQDMYRHQRGADKSGLTTQLIAQSGRLPERLVEGTAITVGGGDYPVLLFPGAGAAGTALATMRFNNARFFVVIVGDPGAPLPRETCSDVVFAPYAGLVGVVAVASTTTPATLATATGGSTTATGTHWGVRGGANVTNLDGIDTEDVDTACATATQVALILR